MEDRRENMKKEEYDETEEIEEEIVEENKFQEK